MTKAKKAISILLSVVMLFTMLTVIPTSATSVATASISYKFTNNDAGYAQGDITLSDAAKGTYYLYWADNTKVLEGYQPITKLTISSSSESKSYTMPEYTAIPANATTLVAVKASSEPDVSNLLVENTSAVYTITNDKKLKYTTDDMIYSFASVSDPQLPLDDYGLKEAYPNADEHLEAAFETLAKRKVDFTVVLGDIVNDQEGKGTYDAEYKLYERILADSSYVNPIYESNGNHELWSSGGTNKFIKETGLDSLKSTISKDKPYYEITEPKSGDHFIFMALEGPFHTNTGTQFSPEQLDWLEGLLKKYHNDGNNIFIIEHANIEGWGSGDRHTNPYYDLGLKKSQENVQRFISLMEKYKKCVIITAHTHIELSAQFNYSDNNGTSAVMMHNSAIGGIRKPENGKLVRKTDKGESEGYIVEVYNSCILFKGINLYHNKIMPSCSYIIPFSTGVDEKPTTAPTTTVKPTTVPPTTVPPTTKPVIEYFYGDADDDGRLSIKDVSTIQLHIAGYEDIITTEKALKQADTDKDGITTVMDATYIQQYIVKLITSFPDKSAKASYVSPANIKAVNLSDALTSVSADLESYYRYSSYDQYQALKKAYKKYQDSSDSSAVAILTEKQEALYDITGKRPGDNIDREYTVYFTNDKNWSTVKAYVWNDSTSEKIASWPGKDMKYEKLNKYNQEIYSFTFLYPKYDHIIFTNGSAQTVNIPLSGDPNVGYYVSEQTSDGKFNYKTYTYS